MAGACATILKAAFDGSFQYNQLPDAITPAGTEPTGTIIQLASADGLTLEEYAAQDKDQITVNGEIDKLASNIALARNFAGIHWRSDAEEGLRLGEKVAISLLRDQHNNYTGEENFKGFAITTFDGKKMIV